MATAKKGKVLQNPLLEELICLPSAELDHLLTNVSIYRELKGDLMETRALSQALLQADVDIAIVFDSTLKATLANKQAENFCENLQGKHCCEIFKCDPENCSICEINEYFKGKKGKRPVKNITVVDQSEKERFFEVTYTPVALEGREVQHVVLVARDVTEKNNMEKQLRYAFKMEAVGTLAGGIAHDFNNLLTPIMGYSEIIRMHMLGEEPSREEVSEYVEEILKAAKRAKKLVEQILTFSRSGEQKESLQYLHPIIKEVMHLIQTTLPSTILIKKEIDENCGMVSVDPVQVHQILINLCTNAANAMAGKQGELVVTLRKSDKTTGDKKWLELAVSDNGCGIEPHLLQRIFEPYYTTREKEQGTGMGLAMLHGIVNRHGGTIEVDSEVGEGTTFRIFLPVSEEKTSLDQVVNPSKIPGGSERILLVDDEAQVVDVARKILENLGYIVTAQTSARQTLDIFTEKSDEFDLLITDQTMPYMTGTELCQRVKEIRKDIPVILFTGYFEEFSKPNAECEIEGFCMKPVSFKEMAITVRRVIDENQA